MNSYYLSPTKNVLNNNFNVLTLRSPNLNVTNPHSTGKHYEKIFSNCCEQVENKENIFDKRHISPRSPSKETKKRNHTNSLYHDIENQNSTILSHPQGTNQPDINVKKRKKRFFTDNDENNCHNFNKTAMAEEVPMQIINTNIPPNRYSLDEFYEAINTEAMNTYFKFEPDPTPEMPFQRVDANFDVVNSLPMTPLLEKNILGSGTVKTVLSASMLKDDTVPTKGNNKYKDVAFSKQSIKNSILNVVHGQITELRVYKTIANVENGWLYMPKVWYAGIKNNVILTITKLISGGDANHCLSNMSVPDRLRALVDVSEALTLLHENGITHNDISLRNMLIEIPTETIDLNKACDVHLLARPILDQAGITIVNSKISLTCDVVETIRNLGIKEVKVLSNQPPKGILNDFGCCTFDTDKVNPYLFINYPQDYIDPVRAKALINHHCCLNAIQPINLADQIIDETRDLQISLQNAAENIQQVTNPKSDAFSFGQLIVDVVLNPSLDTTWNPSNEDYKQTSKLRRDNQLEEYNAMLSGKPGIDVSALDPSDFEELKLIHPELAGIVYDLQKYDQNARLRIDEARALLKPIIIELSENTPSNPISDAEWEKDPRTNDLLDSLRTNCLGYSG